MLPGLSPKAIRNLPIGPRKTKNILKVLFGVLFMIAVGLGIVQLLKNQSESFEDAIEPNKKNLDDALDKRIAEAKETPRFDAELLLDINRPYGKDVNDNLGWWGNVVSGKSNPDIYHKKNPKDWIFPY